MTTSKLLLQLAQRALNDITPHGGKHLDGDPAYPPPFNVAFSTQRLAEEIGDFLEADKGFTVILGYPAGSETYSSTSKADTWEEAVLDVAAQMAADAADVIDGEDVTIVDVLEGATGHSTYPEVDRYAVVRFGDDLKPRLLGAMEAAGGGGPVTERVPYLKWGAPLEFPFHELTNFVPPDKTMEAENIDWRRAKSGFFKLGEYHIFAQACCRQDPGEIEIAFVGHGLSDATWDAVMTAVDIIIDLDDEEKVLIDALNIQAVFRYITVVNARGPAKVAMVRNNTLSFL